VRLMFQPCEEGPESGAKRMVEDGVMDGVDVVVGGHVYNKLDSGCIGAAIGDCMAACHSYEVEFFGKTAHATLPHTGHDALAMAAAAYPAIYMLGARTINPLERFTISVGALQAGHTHNVIPDYAKMLLCVRYFDTEMDRALEARIKQVCQNAAEQFGGTCTVTDPFKGCPVINDPALTERFLASARTVAGEENVYTLSAELGSEDFSEYLKKAPGVFFRIGTRNQAKGIMSMPHNNDFMIDESAMLTGSRTFVQFVLDNMD